MILAGLITASLKASALAHLKAEETAPSNETIVVTDEAIDMRFDHLICVAVVTLASPDHAVHIERETGLDAAAKYCNLQPCDLPAEAYTVGWWTFCGGPPDTTHFRLHCRPVIAWKVLPHRNGAGHADLHKSLMIFLPQF